MTPNTTATKLETALLFALGMVIFLSKPAIYLVSLLLLVLTAIRLVANQNYRIEVFNKRMFWASTGLFFLGVAATAIGSDKPDDLVWIAKKTMLLPMTVPFLIAFAQPINRRAGLSGVLVGFWISFVLTGNMHNWSWSGERLEGATWLVDAWGVICAMLLAFLTPLAFDQRERTIWRLFLIFTITAAFVMLLTTGARGPWLGVIAGIFIFLMVKHRMALVSLCLAGLVAALAGSIIWPTQTTALKSRVSSIIDLDTDSSNNVRLALWETGAAIIKNKFITGDITLWTGMGHDGHIETSTNFYKTELNSKANIKPGLLDETIINDFHNMYIQSMIQNGAVWTFGALILLIAICIKEKPVKNRMQISWPCTPTIINFYVIGLTYTILPHFAFMFLIYFSTLARSTDN